MNAEKWRQSEIRIAINDESKGNNYSQVFTVRQVTLLHIYHLLCW